MCGSAVCPLLLKPVEQMPPHFMSLQPPPPKAPKTKHAVHTQQLFVSCSWPISCIISLSSIELCSLHTLWNSGSSFCMELRVFLLHGTQGLRFPWNSKSSCSVELEVSWLCGTQGLCAPWNSGSLCSVVLGVCVVHVTWGLHAPWKALGHT